ncbi:MAG: DNA replication/repair protein RecF [Acutalibacteraceae bacterium]|nr:DNA replication/repair protein RecF [Acutalibacteraceae bacterium]
MKLIELSFENYRNLKTDKFIADENMNVICGNNAQGKTNLIEAVWLFTGVKSFCGAKDSELININKDNLTLNLSFFGQNREQTATIKIGEKKQVFLNGVKKKNASALAGVFTAVVFSPDHLPLVKSGPGERRKFLNIAISQLWPKYMPLLYEYTRGVGQRNAILKDAKYHNDLYNLLISYENEIAQSGAKINHYRKKYCDLLNKKAQKIYEGISNGKEKLQIEYIGQSDDKEEFLSALEKSRENDIKCAVTSIGPHRDDLSIKINDKSARAFGSQGQQRSAVLAIKLAEAEIINVVLGEEPIILLDDVMSELDEYRQDYILNHIKGKQVFLTCCDKSIAQKLNSGTVFKVRGGEIEKTDISSFR